jgi:hypothetical protein
LAPSASCNCCCSRSGLDPAAPQAYITPSSGTTSHSHCQETYHLSWNLNVHHNVHKSLSTSHLFNEIHKFSVHPCTHFFKINFNIILAFASRSSGILTKFCIYFSFLPHPLILLDLIIIKSDDQHKLWYSSLCNFLRPAAVFFRLGQNTHLSTLFPSTLNIHWNPHLMYLNLKVFTYLTFIFSDPKNFLYLRSSLIHCSNPLLTQRNLKWVCCCIIFTHSKRPSSTSLKTGKIILPCIQSLTVYRANGKTKWLYRTFP